MDYHKTVQEMPVDVYERLRRALETGRWPDGRVLTAQQKENAMQAVIAWGEIHLEAHERIGYIDKGSKSGDICDDPQEQSLNWVEEDEQ